jgi:hypothetical protein
MLREHLLPGPPIKMQHYKCKYYVLSFVSLSLSLSLSLTHTYATSMHKFVFLFVLQALKWVLQQTFTLKP